MNKFIRTILFAALFFIGIGGIIEHVGASFKSDEKALALIKQARQAIGGDIEIQKVKSLTIIGKTTKTFDFDGSNKAEQGDLEINLQMPDKFQKLIKTGTTDSSNNENKEVDVVIVRKGGGEAERTAKNSGDADKNIEVIIDDKSTLEKSNEGEKMRHNELLRTTLFLLLTAPEGVDVAYNSGGEGDVDGLACDIVDATSNGETFKLYLDKSSHLPKMMRYQGFQPIFMKFTKDADKVGDNKTEIKVFDKKLDKPETAQFEVKFSDYRSVNGLRLPFKWTQTMAKKSDEISEISSFEVNPANISYKFKESERQVKIRTKKSQ